MVGVGECDRELREDEGIFAWKTYEKLKFNNYEIRKDAEEYRPCFFCLLFLDKTKANIGYVRWL